MVDYVIVFGCGDGDVWKFGSVVDECIEWEVDVWCDYFVFVGVVEVDCIECCCGVEVDDDEVVWIFGMGCDGVDCVVGVEWVWFVDVDVDVVICFVLVGDEWFDEEVVVV